MSSEPDTRRSFDDLREGESFTFGPYEMVEDQIVAFAQSYDPQPMHLDPAAGRASPLGGLAASGWHSAAVVMRLVYDAWLCKTRGLGSPGIESTDWPRPLLAGQSVLGDGRILSMRVSRKRPHTGLAQIGISMREARSGAEVLRSVWWMMFEREPPHTPAPAGEESGRAIRSTVSPPTRSEAVTPNLKMLYLGGAEQGKPIYIGDVSTSEDEIVAFARNFDPQPFHLDREAAEASLFGGLSASGWHSCALWMRTNVLARQALLAGYSVTERLELEQSAAIGLGFQDLVWPRPVRPGERLHAFMTPLESRQSRNRHGWGVTRWRAEMTNGEGNLVLRFHPSLLMRKP